MFAWRQSADPLDKKVLRFLKINGSRYDLIDELRPFVGKDAAPPGRALYPTDLTLGEVEKYVAAHPGQKEAVYNEAFRFDARRQYTRPLCRTTSRSRSS